MRGILDGPARATRLFAALLVLFWLSLSLPLALGLRTFILRDTFTTHLPFKAFGAEQLAHGELPAFFPDWTLGQPFRGNPNALPFYPTNLLYLVLPFWSAFGLHYVLHWLIAALGMYRLARTLGPSREAALVAAVTYAASGYVLTTLTFMNLLTVAAWAPWTLAGLARGGRRGTALAGVACGLMLLGGEPFVSALVVPLMALVAIERHGWRRGLALAAVAGGIGLLVALPQIVATARILPFTFRVAHGLEARQQAANDVHPFRLLELVLPMPWGWPTSFRGFSFWAPRVNAHTPYVFSLHFGIVALGLALAAAWRRRVWAAAAAGALALAWALGLSPAFTAAVTGGVFRYPQKFLFPFTIAAALLAAFGVERAVAGRSRAWFVGAGACAAVGGGLLAAREPFVALLRDHLVAAQAEWVARLQATHWTVLFGLAALLLAGAGWAVRRRSALGLAAVHALGMLQMAPMWATDATRNYTEAPELLAHVGEPRRLAHVPFAYPYWEKRASYDRIAHDLWIQSRLSRADLEPSFGVFDRLENVVAPDLEGLTSPLTVFLNNNLVLAEWPVRVRWLRRLGTGWVLRNSAAPGPELERVAATEEYSVTTELLRVPDPLPRVSWPARVAVAPNPVAAWQVGSGAGFPDDVALASRPVTHAARGRVTIVEEGADRLVLDVDSDGGLAVVRRTYWPNYRARLASGEELATQPVDLSLLGVEVPAGRHRVTIDVAAWPEATAGALALVALAAALAVAARFR